MRRAGPERQAWIIGAGEDGEDFVQGVAGTMQLSVEV